MPDLKSYFNNGVDRTPLEDITVAQLDPQTSLTVEDEKDPMISGLRARSQPVPITTRGQDILPSDYSKYIGEVYPNTGESYLNKQRAEGQGAGEQFIGFLNQGIVGEVVGGTLEGVGYLTDLRGPAILADDGERSFGQVLVETGKALRSWTEEVTPIYTVPGAKKFDPTSWSWWMSNGKSVFSTLSLMIPAMGTVKGLSMAGKMLGLAGKLGVETAAGLTAVGRATISRHMENMMEAGSIYKEVFDKAIQDKFTPEEATKRASMAASKTYAADWAMLAMDIAQYSLLRRSFMDPSGAGTTSAFGKLLGHSVGKIGLSEGKRYGFEMAGEAFEEGYQWISSEESKYTAEKAFDPSVKGTFDDRVGGYLKSGDLWSNAFFGAVGGGVFTAVGDKVQNWIGGDPQVNEVKSWGVDFKTSYEKMKAGASMGDDYMVKEAQQELKTGIGIRLASKGMLDQGIEMYEKIAKGELSPTEFETLGIDPSTIQDLKGSDIDQLKQEIKAAGMKYMDVLKKVYTPGDPLNIAADKLWNTRTADLKNINFVDYGRQYAALLSKTETKLDDLNVHKIKLDNEVREAENKIINISSLTQSGRKQVLTQALINTYETQKTQIENVTKNRTNIDSEKQRADALEGVTNQKKIDKINAKYDYIAKTKETIDSNFTKDIQTRLKLLDDRIKSNKISLNKLKSSYTSDEEIHDKDVNFDQANLDDYYKKMSVYGRVQSDIDSYQSALNRYKTGEISSDEQRNSYNKDYEDETRDTKDWTPEESDHIGWVDEAGLRHIGIIESIDKEDSTKYEVQEIDEGWHAIGNPITKSLDSLTLLSKIGDLNLRAVEVEAISGKDLTPEQLHAELLENSGSNKALSQLINSLSYINLDMSKPNFLDIRDQRLDSYASDPINRFGGAVATYYVDWENKFWDEGGPERRQFKLKAQAGKLTVDEIKVLLKTAPENDLDFSKELVDKLPIKVSIKVGDQIFDRGLYLHDSDFWNVRAPENLPVDPEAFVLQRRQESRDTRMAVLTELLTGNKVTSAGIKKLNGWFNTVKTDGNVHERLNMPMGGLIVYIGVPGLLGDTVELQSSPTDIRRIYNPSRGGVYVITNKTSSGDLVLLKLNPQKLSVEHADIYWEAMKTAYSGGVGGGFKALMKDDRVEGVNAKEVMSLLALFGDRATNPDHANNVGMAEHLKNKALYVRHEKGKTWLYFGLANKVDLFELNLGKAEQNKQDFIDWAIKNKNYRVPLENKAMGLNLNEPFKRTFKIGSLENNPIDEKGHYAPYSAVLIDRGMIMTNVDRVKDPVTGQYIESITHAPVIDLNLRALDIVKPEEPEEVVPPGQPKAIHPAPATIKTGD
ncbi:MAG: hypothetical protein IMZ64_05280, partial [Bacteroidetes bacterium]|nr:hypothetical protein [Bacteroidota bacterium]